MRSTSLQCRQSLFPAPHPPTPLHFAHQHHYANDMHHMSSPAVIVTELDLSSAAFNPNSISERINAVPGLKTSTAFFTFLRANLALPESAMSSNVNTPLLEPTLEVRRPSPSATRRPIAPSLDDDIPPLSLDVLTTRDDKVEALRLVADSIAQQRQQASLNLVFHPLNVAVLAGGLGIAYQYGGFLTRKDLGTTMTLCSGIIMTYLMAIRYFTSRYIQLAERLNWDWLVGPDGGEDIVIGTRFGSEMIGALVLRLEPGSTAGNGSPSRRRHRGQAALKGGRGVIRGWTTKLRFRGKGVGIDMLDEAVRVTREKCGKDAAIGFAQEHANSQMVVPELYNGAFRKREMRAAKALEKTLSEWEGTRRRR